MQTVKIKKFNIGQENACFVISEIGAMYEDLDGMKELIRSSREAGADAVKVQTYRAENLALEGAEFEMEDGSRMSQYDFFKRYEISEADHRILFEYARQQGIMFFSTPSHYEDVDFLDALDCPIFKTGSDDLTNLPFLDYIARKGKPMIVSTGMATLAEVDQAVHTILSTGNDQLVLLHCTVSYPPEPRFANLRVIETLRHAFNLPTGYSDHIVGVMSSVLAASMGACVIEKHLTLDRSLNRPDSQVSLEPHEMREMIDSIRLVPVLQGSSVKEVTETEKKWRTNARKSLVAAVDLPAGHKLRREDIKIMRPGTGIYPVYLPYVIGRTLAKDVKVNQQILLEDLNG